LARDAATQRIGEYMFESKGIKRTLSSVFSVLACVSTVIPVLAPFQEIFVLLGGALGATGIAHAAVAKSLK